MLDVFLLKKQLYYLWNLIINNLNNTSYKKSVAKV